MNKIKRFFQTQKEVDRKLRKIAKENRKSLITEKDVEFLRSIGIKIDLETLKNGRQKQSKK